mgnify:FL=1
MNVLNRNINNIFFIFALSHLIIWTLIPSLTNKNLPLDTIEASIVSNGKFLFVNEGISVQIIKCDNAKIKKILLIFLFKTFISKYLQ